MSWDNVPWMIAGGAEHSAEVGRLVAYAALGDVEGVVSPGDLKVKALSVPGGFVTMDPGALIVRNRSTGGDQQSYIGRRPSAEDQIPVSPTGGTSRSDLVVVVVKDPQYAPWPAPPAGERANFVYIETVVLEGVGSGVKNYAAVASSFAAEAGDSAYAVARIDVPPSTAAITGAMITDLRKLARPQAIEVVDHVGAGSTADWFNQTASYERIGNLYIDVDVPSWAVTAKVSGFVEGLQLKKSGQGLLRIGFMEGGATTATNINDSSPNYPDRRAYNLGGKIDIPAAYRGQTKRIQIEGQASNTGSKNFLGSDGSSSGQIRVRFEEAPV